jgi:hypothetical protein
VTLILFQQFDLKLWQAGAQVYALWVISNWYKKLSEVTVGRAATKIYYLVSNNLKGGEYMNAINKEKAQDTGIVKAFVTDGSSVSHELNASPWRQVYEGYFYFRALGYISGRDYHIMLRFVRALEAGEYQLPHPDILARTDFPVSGYQTITEGKVTLEKSGEYPEGFFEYSVPKEKVSAKGTFVFKGDKK